VEVIVLSKDKQRENKHSDVMTESQQKKAVPGYDNKKIEGPDRPAT